MSESDELGVLLAEKETDVTSNHDIPPVVQTSTPVIHSTDAIDPLTLSIIPRNENEEDLIASQAGHVIQHSGMKTVGWVTNVNSDNSQVETSTMSATVSTSEPVDDLMKFSITPAAVTQMTNSSPNNAVAMHPPTSKPDLSKTTVKSLSDDLIEFSISPSLLGNAHNSEIQFGSTDKVQPHHYNMLSSHPQSMKPKQSPELRMATRSPELSRHMMMSNGHVSPHQRGYEASDHQTSENGVPQLQRQTSFPFQNKQPAPLQRNSTKTEVQAVPQTSDFASQFGIHGSTTLESDLQPTWGHFAEERQSRSLSASPEAWTVLNAAGDEEATFKAKRQPKESFESKSEEVTYTPAMTSLKRVVSYRSEQEKSEDQTVTTRPLNSHTALPAVQRPDLDNDGSLNSLTAHLSTSSNTARFSTHHRHSANGSTQAGPKSSDLVYIDPDELVFSKPSDAQQQQNYPVHIPPHNVSRGAVDNTGNKDTSAGGKRDNYIEVESGGNRLKPLQDHSIGAKAQSERSVGSEMTGGKSSVTGGSSESNRTGKPAEYSSPPITADPLYALPERLKRKLLPQAATSNTSSDTIPTTGTTNTTPSAGTTTTAPSSSPAAMKTSSTSATPITGAGYLTMLLQERQSARQQSSAKATTPTGDLLEASTKADASSHVTNLPSPSESNGSSRSISKPKGGKEYLQELLQKRQEPRTVSTNQSLGEDPLYAVPDKLRYNRGPTQTESNGITTVSDQSHSIQASRLGSTATGKDPPYAVPHKHQSGAQSVSKAMGEHIPTKTATPLGPQKTFTSREYHIFPIPILTLALSPLSCVSSLSLPPFAHYPLCLFTSFILHVHAHTIIVYQILITCACTNIQL